MVGGTNWFYGSVSKFVPPLYLLGEVQKDIFVSIGRYKSVQMKRTNQGAGTHWTRLLLIFKSQRLNTIFLCRKYQVCELKAALILNQSGTCGFCGWAVPSQPTQKSHYLKQQPEPSAPTQHQEELPSDNLLWAAVLASWYWYIPQKISSKTSNPDDNNTKWGMGQLPNNCYENKIWFEKKKEAIRWLLQGLVVLAC